MAEVVQLCFRSNSEKRVDKDDIQHLSERVLPDNFTPDPPVVVENDRYLIGVLNPRGAYVREDSVGLGTILDDDWTELGSQTPEGSFAIFRNDSKYTELVSDIVGSRTIWYGFTDELFVASTLQRAVVSFLQEYTPDPQAQAWMLSAGMLGPYRSWAKEVEQLRPNTILRLDRDSWEIENRHRPATFETVNRSPKEHYREMVDAIEETFSEWSVSPSSEVLTLSGGYDSRALLHHLSSTHPEIETLTWGTPQSQETELSDADIAQRLAQSYNVEHRFESLETTDVSIETVIERFIQAGEGRIDHLSGYLDGFSLWEGLHTRGTERVIRGDEGFGWIPPITRFTSPAHVRQGVGLTKMSDYDDLDTFDFSRQRLPDHLDRMENEHLGDWRDRLYHDVRIPTTLAALNGLKSPYVELSNPLLSARIISCVRQQPVELRDDKNLFKQYVDSISPDVPYATRSANPSLSSVLSTPEAVAYLDSELERAATSTELPQELVAHIHEHIEPSPPSPETHSSSVSNFVSMVKAHAPRTVIDAIKRFSDDNISPDYNRLALRIVIIVRMNEILREDADMGYSA
ncbi:asparagine synthetase B family protein [Natronorubrum bangense]|uniref:Asparagine synthetase domain-containing protein n=1 Tax=Natronorubrum bangense JCM 10635 TaxID=1227500 RepID=L9W033_9EURY|nr:hypothetical protein [Natronorubrum bangense]ELY42656.1 hypothetical protein C494_20168 [Natronorubrum bangense JCM 10635]